MTDTLGTVRSFNSSNRRGRVWLHREASARLLRNMVDPPKKEYVVERRSPHGDGALVGCEGEINTHTGPSGDEVFQ
jgi:hypothetical protein